MWWGAELSGRNLRALPPPAGGLDGCSGFAPRIPCVLALWLALAGSQFSLVPPHALPALLMWLACACVPSGLLACMAPPLALLVSCSPSCPLSGLPSSQIHRLPAFPPPSLPSLPCTLRPDLLWQLCACLSGRFHQLLCRGGLCCCVSGVAVLGGFVSFALPPCTVSHCPLVTAVCLPVWPLSPALVPGWACCCISGAAAFGGFCFCFFFLAVGCVAFWFPSRCPASCRAP